jgi:hypothetical protein
MDASDMAKKERKPSIEGLWKRRDIARAYHANEGSIVEMATRFSASTRTVQEAIKHDDGWWQAAINTATKERKAAIAPVPFEFQHVSLAPDFSREHGVGFSITGDHLDAPVRVEGTISDVMNALAKLGWETIQELFDPAGGIKGLLIKRRI